MALGDQAYERLRQELDSKQGSANAFEGMILEQGLDFAYPNMTMVDAQYVETRRSTVEEICRWFRVPPHKVAELSRAHFANVENLNIDYATDTLMPWVRRLEEEADWKLVSPRMRPEYTKIALGEIMRGDSESRARWYKEMSQIGVFSINEIRQMEDLDPIGPEGDEHFMQSQYTTLTRIVEEAKEPPEDDEEEAVQPVESVAARLFETQLKKVVSARDRYKKREEFAAWVTKLQESSSGRYERAMGEVTLAMKIDSAMSIVLAGVYAEAEREQLFRAYDEEPVNQSEIVAKLMEAIHAN